MSLFFNVLSSISSSSNDPDITVPAGDPSVNVVNDISLIPNNVTATGGWYGRTGMKKLSDNYWIMAYREAEAHHLNVYGKIHVKFSNDQGDTWTAEDTTLEGGAVTGMPTWPTGGAPGDSPGPGEPWLYLAPNGHLILHMWKADYNGVADSTWGTWQTISTDLGRTWGGVTRVDFNGIANDQRIYATDDDFVLNGVIYAGARVYPTNSIELSSGIKSILIKSTDNGQTWDYVSDITDYFIRPTTEYGLTYVNNDRIVAFMRDANRTKSYLAFSDDLGLTWGTPSEIQATVGATGRQRVYSRSFLKGTDRWWEDPVLICQGFEFPTPGISHPRRIAVWVSKDFGNTWSAPLYLRIEGYDGGYGDVLYNKEKDEYVTTMYYAPTSLFDGEVRQINWKLNFI